MLVFHCDRPAPSLRVDHELGHCVRIEGTFMRRGVQAGGGRPMPPPATRRYMVGRATCTRMPSRTRRRGDALRTSDGSETRWGQLAMLVPTASVARDTRRVGPRRSSSSCSLNNVGAHPKMARLLCPLRSMATRSEIHSFGSGCGRRYADNREGSESAPQRPVQAVRHRRAPSADNDRRRGWPTTWAGSGRDRARRRAQRVWIHGG